MEAKYMEFICTKQLKININENLMCMNLSVLIYKKTKMKIQYNCIKTICVTIKINIIFILHVKHQSLYE